MCGTLRGVRGFGDPRAVNLPSGAPVWFQPDGKGGHVNKGTTAMTYFTRQDIPFRVGGYWRDRRYRNNRRDCWRGDTCGG